MIDERKYELLHRSHMDLRDRQAELQLFLSEGIAHVVNAVMTRMRDLERRADELCRELRELKNEQEEPPPF